MEPKILSFPAGTGTRLNGTPTPMDIETIARGAARREIMVTAKALADQIQQTIQKSMNPYSKNFSDLLKEQNKAVILLNALVGVLIEKKLLTRNDIEKEVTSLTEQAMKAYQAMVERQTAKKNAPLPVAEPAAVGETVHEPAGDAGVR